MKSNQFENSRVSEGSMRKGAQKIEDGPRKARDESKAVSRDDARDGAKKKRAGK